MKIAILTQPLDTNYGGILQCYALQTILERMGHEVQVLTKTRYGYSYYIIYPLAVCKRMVKRYILGKDVSIWKAPHELRRKNTERFVKQYIHQYKCRKFSEKIAYKFDAVIVGSDQVWRPAYSKPIEEAFLSFLGDTKIKRIAYAASFGLDNCEEFTSEQLMNCSALLQKFNAVSVREFSGIELCKKFFGTSAVQMLDPTLLLSVDDYQALTYRSNTSQLHSNILVYILDKTDEKVALVDRIAKDKGLIPFWIDSPNEIDEKLPLNKQIKISVEQWLRNFETSEFVLTDSFHGCVFSILFKKQFIVIGNKERGLSRFNSLLELFSLKERMVISCNEYLGNCSLIDYNIISNKLSLLQKKSLSFLDASLKYNTK